MGIGKFSQTRFAGDIIGKANIKSGTVFMGNVSARVVYVIRFVYGVHMCEMPILWLGNTMILATLLSAG